MTRAMMDHLNIARVLDAGATETGRPYFVMELVRGIPITTLLRRNGTRGPDDVATKAQVRNCMQAGDDGAAPSRTAAQ